MGSLLCTFCIHTVFTDVTELHNLVGLSLLEDNVHKMDRIAQLHTVGSAIAPLVYKLEADSGLHGLLKACEPIWKAIEANPRLPNLFVSCLWFYSYCMLSKNTLGVKKCKANRKQHCQQVGVTKNFDAS